MGLPGLPRPRSGLAPRTGRSVRRARDPRRHRRRRTGAVRRGAVPFRGRGLNPPGRPLILLPGGRPAAGDPVLVVAEGDEPRPATALAAGFSSEVFRDDVVVAYPDGTRDLVDDRALLRGSPPPNPARKPSGRPTTRRPGPRRSPLPGDPVEELPQDTTRR